jgi:hypothetical protein
VGRFMLVLRLVAVTAVALYAADDVVQQRRQDGEKDTSTSHDELQGPELGVGKRQPSEEGAYSCNENYYDKGPGGSAALRTKLHNITFHFLFILDALA